MNFKIIRKDGRLLTFSEATKILDWAWSNSLTQTFEFSEGNLKVFLPSKSPKLFSTSFSQFDVEGKYILLSDSSLSLRRSTFNSKCELVADELIDMSIACPCSSGLDLESFKDFLSRKSLGTNCFISQDGLLVASIWKSRVTDLRRILEKDPQFSSFAIL